MLIEEVSAEERTVKLCKTGFDREKNIYSLLVGKNGSGKSRLLRNICLLNIASLVSSKLKTDSFNAQYVLEKLGLNGSESIKIITRYATQKVSLKVPNPYAYRLIAVNPTRTGFTYKIDEIKVLREIDGESNFEDPKIIAVSSSPFDKFPKLEDIFDWPKEHSKITEYIYRGARTNQNFQRSYLQTKFDQLGGSIVQLFSSKERRKIEIYPLFRYLELNEKFTIVLKSANFFKIKNHIVENPRDLDEEIQSARLHRHKFAYSERLSEELKAELLSSIRKIYNKYQHTNKEFSREEKYRVELDLSLDKDVECLRELSLLAEYDLLELQDIEFIKTASGTKFNLTEASSGEQCVIFNIFSIAGAISDDSIILIDEPELSLHPDWQGKFLPLLEESFKFYNRCHFIIATHSPQIVSSIPKDNSYLINLELGHDTILEGSKVSAQSADFQLAYIFSAPGYRNEHLITKIIELLSKIRDNQIPIQQLEIEANNLLEFYEVIPDADPVKTLLETLREILEAIKNAGS